MDKSTVGQAQVRETPLAQIDGYPELSVLLTVWRASLVGNMPPPRIDPLAMPRRLLPGALLADIEREAGLPETARLRIRLAGTMLCDLCGRELKGRALDELMLPADAAVMVTPALIATREVRPMLVHRRGIRFRNANVSYVALLLPLTGDDGLITRVLEMPDPDTVHRRRHSDAA